MAEMVLRVAGLGLAVSLLGFNGWAWAQATPEDAIPAQLSLVEAEQIFLSRGLDLLIAEYGARGAAAGGCAEATFTNTRRK